MKQISLGAYERASVASHYLVSGDDDYLYVPEDRVIDKDLIEKFKENIKFIVIFSRYLKLTASQKYLQRIIAKLDGKEPYTVKEYEADAEVINNLIEDEMNGMVFGFIPKDKTDYFNQNELFGKAVFENFPSAREEIKEAGKCYAMDLNTACVFHLMRVVEIGVKAMYWQMTKRKKVVIEKYKKGIAAKKLESKPIELCDWNTLVKGLNIALEKLDAGKRKSVAKNQNHAYFNRLVKLFDNFRSGWRNVISHGNEIDTEKRTLFKEGETFDLMNDTKRFMQLLAERVKE